MTTKVVNLHKESYDIYIGREGQGLDGTFGNPFNEGSRFEKVAKYKEYFLNRMSTDKEFEEKVNALKGKRLGCFCYPLRCHGMVIVEYLENISIEDQLKDETDIL